MLTNCLVPFSKLEHPLGLEADVTPQMKSSEPVSSQAQSLTKKYQETKELLKLQELKKRNMQAQLGLSLSHLPIKEPNISEPQKTATLDGPSPELVQKTVTFLLQDSSEAIQELDLITDEPLTLIELSKMLKLHSCNQNPTGKHELQKLLETWKCQQEMENETLKKSLARAGESIREYEARLLTMEDMMGKVQKQSLESLNSPYGPLSTIETHSESNDATVGLLSQKVKLLTAENSALKQRCQEIVNQLTEADREIDRLKAELVSQHGGKQHHLVVEELKRLKAEVAENQANAIDREYYERELNEKSLRLHEALVTLEELGNTLKDTEKKLQLKEATLRGLGFQGDYEDEELQLEKEHLRELLEASKAKISETDARVQSVEQRCVELEARNGELLTLNQELEKVGREKLAEAENEVKRLQEKLEWEIGRGSESKDVEEKQGDDGDFKHVVDEFEMRSEAFDRVIEMLVKVDVSVDRMLGDLKTTFFGSSKEEPVCVREEEMRSVLEWEFWNQLLSITQLKSDESRQIRELGLVELIASQRSLILLNKMVCSQGDAESETVVRFATMHSWLDDETNALILQRLTETLKAKSHDLKQIANSLKTSKNDTLLSLAQASIGFGREKKQSSEYLLDCLKEACRLYELIRLKVQHEKELKQNQPQEQMGSTNSPNFSDLKEVASELESKREDPQNQLCGASLKTAAEPQTLIQIQGEPVDSVGATTELHDMVVRHRKELHDVKDCYEQEVEKLRLEITKANETLQLQSEENLKEMDSLTNCMEILKTKHEDEKRSLVERFDQEMEELRSMMSPANTERNGTSETSPHPSAPTSTLRERIQELMVQVSVLTEETRRREEQGDINTLRLKCKRDLENLKVEALLVLAVLPSVMPCFPLTFPEPPFPQSNFYS